MRRLLSPKGFQATPRNGNAGFGICATISRGGFNGLFEKVDCRTEGGFVGGEAITETGSASGSRNPSRRQVGRTEYSKRSAKVVEKGEGGNRGGATEALGRTESEVISGEHGY